jgi:hypothetical protein
LHIKDVCVTQQYKSLQLRPGKKDSYHKRQQYVTRASASIAVSVFAEMDYTA